MYIKYMFLFFIYLVVCVDVILLSVNTAFYMKQHILHR